MEFSVENIWPHPLHWYMTLVTLKIRWRLPKSMIYYGKYVSSVPIWMVKKIQCRPLVTLELRSRSPISIHLLRSSQWCICVSLSKKLECRQGFFIVIWPWWPWKLNHHGQQNVIIYKCSPNDVSVSDRSKSGCRPPKDESVCQFSWLIR